MDNHFNVDDLYLIMINKKYHVSNLTSSYIYNTIEIFLDAGLIRKHHGEKHSLHLLTKKSYFDKQMTI